MKRLCIWGWGIWAVALSVMSSCGNMDDTYKEFLQGGERIYAGRVLDVRALSGNEKLTVIWKMPADPNISEFRIFWNNGADSIVHSVSDEVKASDRIVHEISPLAPATYYLEIYSVDIHGRSSVKTEFTGISYPKGNVIEEN